MQSLTPKESDVTNAMVTYYSGLYGSLALCLLIHFFAPTLSSDQSLMRMGLVILFFACLASATWSLLAPYEQFISIKLHWQYGDGSPAVRRSIERVASRKARYYAGLGTVGTIASGLWALAILSGWPIFSILQPFQDILSWLAFFAWLAVPLMAIVTLRHLREAMELQRQADEEMRHSGARVRDADHSAKTREDAIAPPVQVLAPLSFRAAGYDWSWGDFYKNAAIFGMSGSGKTICVLNALLDGLIASSSGTSKPCSGLILDPKGDFSDKVVALCRQHGRERDLVIIDPANLDLSMKWNPIDSNDDALEVAGRFGAVMQVLSEKSDNDTFWIESTTRLVQNLISLLRFADPGTPPSLVDVYEAAMNDDRLREIRDRISDETFATNRSARRTGEYFRDVWVPMPDETKGSVRSYVANMLGSFLVEPYDELFAGRSDVTMSEIVEDGLILYVNMPIADRETMARVVSTFIKLEFYREVLKRPNKERPSFFLCDEFQSFFTVGQGRGDPDAFERTRQSNHANIIAFQNMNALLKQTSQREQVMNLLGNCATKLFLRNTDEETNKYASALFGKHIENLGSTSINIGRGARQRGGSASLSGSDQYQDRVKQEDFSTLVVPSREDAVDHAEAIGHLAARSAISMERLRWRVHPIGKGKT